MAQFALDTMLPVFGSQRPRVQGRLDVTNLNADLPGGSYDFGLRAHSSLPRDSSALDLLEAWNTGRRGGLATVHANSALEGFTRLEDLIGEMTQPIPYRAIAQAINILVPSSERWPGARSRQ